MFEDECESAASNKMNIKVNQIKNLLENINNVYDFSPIE